MNIPKPSASVHKGTAVATPGPSLESGATPDTRVESLRSPNGLESIYQPIAQELAAVEKIVENELSNDTPWVDRLLEDNWIRGGKRIRPVLVLLSGGACGGIREGHLYLSAAIELIHAASLVHDDVIDKADIRRHLPTVNATWGNRTSVLLGDFLFTHAFYVASLAENTKSIKEIARSSNRVCEGEIRQNASEGDFELPESEYMTLIQDKTGELCRCSCVVGALVAGADQKRCEAFGEYGLKLGVAFQIIDDVLDLVGHQKKVGKTLATDVTNQKATLPVLHSLRVSPPAQRSVLLQLLKEQPVDIGRIVAFLNSTGSIDYAQNVAKGQLHDALNFAQQLPESEYSTALENLAYFVLNRTH